MLAVTRRTTAAARAALGRTDSAAAAAGAASVAVMDAQAAALARFGDSFAADMAQEQVQPSPTQLRTSLQHSHSGAMQTPADLEQELIVWGTRWRRRLEGLVKRHAWVDEQSYRHSCLRLHHVEVLESNAQGCCTACWMP